MQINNHVKRGHPITFGLLIFFSIIELAISAWLVSMFNKHHNELSGGVSDRTRYLLFTSIWTVCGSFVLMLLFLVFANAGIFTSVVVHLVYLALTWIFWTAGAAAITAALGGGLDCNLGYIYCAQLNALEGFAWICWILTTFAIVVVMFRSVSSHKRGDGWTGQLV
ncbi:hypothetical protein BJ322DRAFT_1056193 [Thelephora terrestris]|uniref:MARVEL domain-containing protein n=1 Tax=Thelephora terrestris TaxID=56493 RepID=A0A9P6L7L8_9AGAM|nr:hypothetical protein BJ322DRAFT_1056193 [Thelephora terrestris]